jgi:probable rRNA maturation factor
MKLLRVFNRQKSRKLNGVLMRRIARHLLEELLDCHEYELGIHLIDASEMAELNETFLGHAGSTDVITFNHQEGTRDPGLHGEIFISVYDAVVQAGQFQSTWQSEVVRYLAHGLLHLQGHDDVDPRRRRAMKREENKLVKELSGCFDLGKLGGANNGSGRK